MKTKFLLFFSWLSLALCMLISGGPSLNYDVEGGYLRIFTPLHNVVETLAPYGNSGKVIFTNGKNMISDQDYKLMAKIVYCESKGEPFLGKVGVASVILNRLYDPHFPKTIQGVIYQKNAFSCVSGGQVDANPDSECYRAVDEALAGNDPTSESIYFYNPKYSSSSWIFSCPKKSTVTIGNHIFFR